MIQKRETWPSQSEALEEGGSSYPERHVWGQVLYREEELGLLCVQAEEFADLVVG